MKYMKKIKSDNLRQLVNDVVPIINSDDKIELKEIDELYQLFYWFNYSSEERANILNKIISNEKVYLNTDKNKLLQKYNSVEKFIYLKEIMKFESFQTSKIIQNTEIINKLIKLFKIKRKTLDKIKEIIATENYFFDIKNWDGEKGIENIAKVGSVVASLTALYFLGVTGFSGSGILSGLAAIGALFGSIGFSPAIGGLIILILFSFKTKNLLEKKVLPTSIKKLKKLLNKILKVDTMQEEIIKTYMDIRNNIEIDIKKFSIKFFDIFKKNYRRKRKLYIILKELYILYNKRIEKLEKIR